MEAAARSETLCLVGRTSRYNCVTFQCNQDNRQSSKKNYKYQWLYTYGCTS